MNRLQVFRQVPADSKLCRQFAAVIADNGETKLIGALGLPAVSGCLLRDGNEKCTARFDVVPSLLERLKVEIAVRTPGTAIESQDEGTFGQQVLGRHELAVRIG